MPHHQLLVATTNVGKQREFSALLADSPLEIVFPDIDPRLSNLNVEENGETFESNALLKARAYAEVSQLLTVADDSGLEVAALENQPGVQSKRFFLGSDLDRMQEVIQRLHGLENRSARFISVLCLYDPETQVQHFFRGIIEGHIAEEAKGEAGFGYDPIFIPSGFANSFAELGQEVKNNLSHRSRAIEKLHHFLHQHFPKINT